MNRKLSAAIPIGALFYALFNMCFMELICTFAALTVCSGSNFQFFILVLFFVTGVVIQAVSLPLHIVLYKFGFNKLWLAGPLYSLLGVFTLRFYLKITGSDVFLLGSFEKTDWAVALGSAIMGVINVYALLKPNNPLNPTLRAG